MTLGSIRAAVVVVFLLAAAAAPAADRPSGFKFVTVTTTLDEYGLPKKLVRKEIFFIGDGAFVLDADGVADMRIDLRKQVVSDEQGAKWAMTDLQQRADQEKEAALKRLDTTKDAAAADRIKYEADPAFTYTDENGKVIASNPLVRYEMQCAAVDPSYVKRLYLALRMLTLTGASPTSPPYTMLALADELERRGSIIQDARVISKAGPGGGADKQNEMRIQSRLSPLSDDDEKRLATLLLPAGGL